MSRKTTQNKGDGRVTAGVKLWLRTAKINPSVRGHRRLEAYLRLTEQNFVQDLGGPDNMTTAQEVLLKGTMQALGVLLLAGAYCQKYSILRPDQAAKGVIELQPCLGQQYLSFLNTIRQNLVVLGMDRRKAEPILTPFELAAAIDEEKASKAREAGEAKIEAPDAKDGHLALDPDDKGEVDDQGGE